MGKSRINSMKRDDRLILIYKLSYMLLFFVAQIFFFMLNDRAITNPYDFTTVLDEFIPFSKYFIVFYVYWYFYLAFGFLFFIIKDYKKYFILLGTILLGEFISMIIYYFIPSTIQRPVIFGNDIFLVVTNLIYKSDSHFNCLPSLHIIETWLISILLLEYKKTNAMRVFVWISTIGITLSTMFVKQHAALDIFVSIVFTYALYYLLSSDKILRKKKVKQILDFIIPEIVRHNWNEYKYERIKNEKIYRRQRIKKKGVLFKKNSSQDWDF